MFKQFSPLIVLANLAIALLPISLISLAPVTPLLQGTLVQLLTCGTLLYASNKSQTISLKPFWQYFALAMWVGLLASLFQLFFSQSYYPLFSQFSALLTYLLIILAIESSPHVTERKTQGMLNSRFPSVAFVVCCFCYFVLLPVEFGEQSPYFSTRLFHLITVGLIFFRLISHLSQTHSRCWRMIYGLLLAAAALLIAKNLSLLNNSAIANNYWLQIATLLPFSFTAAAACFSVRYTEPLSSPPTLTYRELYLTGLTLLLLVIELIGREYQLSYIVATPLQLAVVLLWCAIAILSLVLASRQRLRIQQRQRQNQETNDQQIAKLIQQVTTFEHAYRHSEERAIVKNSNNAILTTDSQGIILSANPAAVSMFQYLEQDLIASPIKHLFSSDDELHVFFDFQSNIYSLQRKKQGRSSECLACRSDGSTFPVQVELHWAEREQHPLIIVNVINLTARKHAEQQALELKDKFIANISHEFRTPLTIINGIIDRYIASAHSANEQQELSTAKRNGLRLVRMVEQLLELSRISDNPKLQLHHYRLSTLMSMPNESFKRLAHQHQLSFSADIPDELWLDCDPQAFEKIVFNLLANAIKYTPSGGDVKVVATADNDTILLEFIDSGIGIKKSAQEKIFERFQRNDDPLNAKTFGVGIGLSLVNELVNAHGWQINLVSAQGQGSKFTLVIPLAPPQLSEDTLPTSMSEQELTSLISEQPQIAKPQKDKHQQVVLVIEDNMDMQHHIKQVVEQEHHVLLADSGEQGLKLAQEYLPDLIVCDLMLTGIDGFEVLQQIKQHELTAHIPVILLTARSDLESRLTGLNLNADEYLSKPFNHQELLIRIQNLMDNRQQLQQSYRQQFDRQQQQKRRVSCDQTLQDLTATPEPQPDLDDLFLERVAKCVAENYTEQQFDVVQLASELAVSERQLQRKIKVLMGTSPKNYIRDFRLEKAAELLKSGRQIGHIALDVGFSSQAYFGRCFKERFNCTPKQFQSADSKNL